MARKYVFVYFCLKLFFSSAFYICFAVFEWAFPAVCSSLIGNFELFDFFCTISRY